MRQVVNPESGSDIFKLAADMKILLVGGIWSPLRIKPLLRSRRQLPRGVLNQSQLVFNASVKVSAWKSTYHTCFLMVAETGEKMLAPHGKGPQDGQDLLVAA